MMIEKNSNISPHNNSETFTNEHNTETYKEWYISSEERQNIVDDFRLLNSIIMEC